MYSLGSGWQHSRTDKMAKTNVALLLQSIIFVSYVLQCCIAKIILGRGRAPMEIAQQSKIYSQKISTTFLSASHRYVALQSWHPLWRGPWVPREHHLPRAKEPWITSPSITRGLVMILQRLGKNYKSKTEITKQNWALKCLYYSFQHHIRKTCI